MGGPGIINLNGVVYISVGDALALARITHRQGKSAADFANALATLILPVTAKKQVPTKPLQKKKRR